MACRLDRFYVSSSVSAGLIKVSTFLCPDSDHSYILLEFRVSPDIVQTGSGYWKCNISHFSSPEFVRGLESLCSLLNDVRVFDGQWWEHCKGVFKDYIVQFSKEKARKRVTVMKEKESQLANLAKLNIIFGGKFIGQIRMLREEILVRSVLYR